MHSAGAQGSVFFFNLMITPFIRNSSFFHYINAKIISDICIVLLIL